MINKEKLTSRYFFEGQLVLLSALHVGGGKLRYNNTDSPVVRTAGGDPFIPGSSFKGVFRSSVEKILASLEGFEPCQIFDQSNNCPTVHQEEYNEKRKNLSEDDFLEKIKDNICSGCRLFGSPYSAGILYFQDLYPKSWSGIIPVRDGVAIDRDSERAVDKMKYDYEVVEAGAVFDMSLHLENPDEPDLATTSVGLQELINGFFYLGGKRSRGLGHCRLENLKIYFLDLSKGDENKRMESLHRYLTGITLEEKMPPIENVNQFLGDNVKKLVS